MCLIFLNAMILTKFQVIHYKHERCNSGVNNDLLLKVREMQVELSTYRESMEQTMETERLLQDRLSKVEHDYLTFRNASIESKRQLQEQITLLKKEVAEYKNESMDTQRAVEDELKGQGRAF